VDLLADLRAKKETLSGEIVHDIPYKPEQIALQNTYRGCISVIEDLLELEQEFKNWKATL